MTPTPAPAPWTPATRGQAVVKIRQLIWALTTATDGDLASEQDTRDEIANLVNCFGISSGLLDRLYADQPTGHHAYTHGYTAEAAHA